MKYQAQKQTIMAFHDQEDGKTDVIPHGNEVTQNMNYTELSSLSVFLERPTLIHTLNWVEGTPIAFTDIYPWQLFLNNTRIKSKLNNFNFLRARLHLKAIVSCSPFYYGLVQYAYQPLNGLTNNNASGGSVLMPMSQRHCIWVTPQSNEGGELVLPFFYHRDWLDICFNNNTVDMGRIHVNEFVNLQSANGVAGENVTIQLFAWLEDIEMCGPTLNLALQSDEYKVDNISGISNTVAAIADQAVELPVIGAFAKTTSQVASGIGKIASLFGFSDPPEISNVKAFKNLPFHGLASSDLSEPSSKLTLDSKAELAIDPTIVGLDSKDELLVDNIAAKYSYLTTATWNTADSVNALKFFTPVTPGYRARGTALGTGVYPISWTPMGHMSHMFANWKGDITFKVWVIASKYHRGRLLFTWDPAGDLTTTSDVINTSFTRVLDIGHEHTFEITIPYLQARPWLYTEFAQDGTTANIYQTSAFTNTLNTERHNGAVSIQVQNVLTAPSGTAPVYILIFVKSDKLELANPVSINSSYNFFVPQSDRLYLNYQSDKEGQESQSSTAVDQLFPDELDANIYNVNFGDPVKSIRTLLRRSTMMDVVPFTVLAPDFNIQKHVLQQTRYPVFNGYNPNSPYTALSVLGGANAKYYFAFTTPLNWMIPAFVGMRGAIRWHYNVLSSTNIPYGHMRIYRDVNPSAGSTLGTTTSVLNTVFGNITRFAIGGLSKNGNSGEVLMNQISQTGLSAEFPYQSMSRMSHCDVNWAWGGLAVDESNAERFYLELYKFGNNSQVTDLVERHVSIGTDFNLHYYLNAPDCWWSPIPADVT